MSTIGFDLIRQPPSAEEVSDALRRHAVLEAKIRRREKVILYLLWGSALPPLAIIFAAYPGVIDGRINGLHLLVAVFVVQFMFFALADVLQDRLVGRAHLEANAILGELGFFWGVSDAD